MSSNTKQLAAAILLLIAALILAGLVRAEPARTFDSPILPRKLYVPLVVHNYKAPSPKKGANVSIVETCDRNNLNASWFQTWNPESFGCDTTGFIPGLVMPEKIGQPLQGGSRVLFNINEPDLNGITPEQWLEYQAQIEATYPNMLYVAPAVSQLHPEWLVQAHDLYVAHFQREPWYALAAHAYFDTVPQFQAHVQWFIDRANEWGCEGGVYVNEFAFWPTRIGLESAIANMQTVVAWMEANPHITGYAWFTNRVSHELWEVNHGWEPVALIDYYTGEYTALGEAYRALPR